MRTARAARAVQLSGACGRANKERGYPSVENFWNDLNKLLSDFYKVTVYKGRWVQYLEGLGMTIALAALACRPLRLVHKMLVRPAQMRLQAAQSRRRACRKAKKSAKIKKSAEKRLQKPSKVLYN